MIDIVTIPTITTNESKTVRIDCHEKGFLTGITLIRSAGANNGIDDAVVQLDVKVYDDKEVDNDRLIFSATITTATSLNVTHPFSYDKNSVNKQYEAESYYGESESNPRLCATVELSGTTLALVTNYDFKLRVETEPSKI